MLMHNVFIVTYVYICKSSSIVLTFGIKLLVAVFLGTPAHMDLNIVKWTANVALRFFPWIFRLEKCQMYVRRGRADHRHLDFIAWSHADTVLCLLYLNFSPEPLESKWQTSPSTFQSTSWSKASAWPQYNCRSWKI